MDHYMAELKSCRGHVLKPKEEPHIIMSSDSAVTWRALPLKPTECWAQNVRHVVDIIEDVPMGAPQGVAIVGVCVCVCVQTFDNIGPSRTYTGCVELELTACVVLHALSSCAG